MGAARPGLCRVSVVVPVYRGELTLTALVAELSPMFAEGMTPAGVPFVVHEVVLVWDNGPDASDAVIRQLEASVDQVKAVWLVRNFGQHPATMAGMSASSGDWVVTMDEDGQHNPADIPRLLDAALRERATLVYAQPTNSAPHGWARNVASRAVKWFLRVAAGARTAHHFSSYRLIQGDVARSVSAYAGHGAYLDVALEWVVRRMVTCPVALRDEGRGSGYSLASLIGHFWRMVITSGTRMLRAVTVMGTLLGLAGIILTVWLVVHQIVSPVPVPGWTSLMCVTLVSSGFVLIALGVVAEYVGVLVTASMGRPAFLVGSDPEAPPGPVGAE